MCYEDKPMVSLIIPTLNRCNFLENSLADALVQDYLDYEVIVVDQSKVALSPTITDLIRHNFKRLKYYKVKFQSLPVARNFGARQAQGRILIYIDDDTRFGVNFVSEHVKAYSISGKIVMVAGGIDDTYPDLDKKVGYFNKWLWSGTRGFGSNKNQYVDHVPGGNFSIAKEVLLKLGGFDEKLSVGAALYEELELCLRIASYGYVMYFNAQARVQHLRAASGGCRVNEDMPGYIFGLAHNRSILIKRYLPKVGWIISYIRLFLLFLSYARLTNNVNVIYSGIKGCWVGIKDRGVPLVVTKFDLNDYHRVLL